MFRLVAVAWLMACCWTNAVQAQIADDPVLAARAEAYLRPYAASGQFSGVVLVAKDGHLLFERAYGMADFRRRTPMRLDTTFSIASLTKTFTAAAIVKLQQDGKLSVEGPLSAVIADFPNGGNITFDELLRHTSGVGQFDTPDVYLDFSTVTALAGRVALMKPLFAPGAGDEYSNEGYVLLARSIERVAGRPYGDYLSRTFFKPIGMTATRLETRAAAAGRARGARAVLDGPPVPLERDEAPLFGASGLMSSAADLYRWARSIHDKAVVDLSPLKYPYGWGKRTYQGHKLIEQSGEVEGFGSYLAVYDDGYDVICLSNIQSGMQGRWGSDFAAVIFGGAVSSPPSIKAPASLRPPADVAGDYRNPDVGYAFRLRSRAGRLESTWGPFPFWRPVSVAGKDELFIVADYTRLVIRRDAVGHVTGLAMPPLDGGSPGPEFRKMD